MHHRPSQDIRQLYFQSAAKIRNYTKTTMKSIFFFLNVYTRSTVIEKKRQLEMTKK